MGAKLAEPDSDSAPTYELQTADVGR